MSREAFIKKRFNRSSLEIIQQANEIISEYMAAGYVLTLRQLYYQFVARALLENQQKEYKRLGNILNDARMAGLVDWQAMEDRTRFVRRLSTWSSPEAILQGCAQQFRFDIWERQPVRLEVWIEKDALIGVIEGVCDESNVPYFACRGYTSQSEQYRAGKRFERWRQAGQRVIVLHLGDHDPSGVDMSRDNFDRLNLFCRYYDVELERLALNMDQVKEWNPPPNPAKDTDVRFAGYVEKYGEESWELDALDPKTISSLISDKIDEYRDVDIWMEDEDRQEAVRDKLAKIAANYDSIQL